ncbi:hypothetical protein ACFFRE_00935 [Aciditerrimonas ferrireducens]|uniref:Uncharacterized protein n=1 Tax=Aciditerrimonas ferrireducens TaxID=667306 RepID=A0ABV6BZ66_9ACTN
MTLEIVHFVAPGRVEFTLLRGPVPDAKEAFVLSVVPDGTVLDSRAELGVDLDGLERLSGGTAAQRWGEAVANALAAIKVESDRRAAHEHGRRP